MEIYQEAIRERGRRGDIVPQDPRSKSNTVSYQQLPTVGEKMGTRNGGEGQGFSTLPRRYRAQASHLLVQAFLLV